MGRKVKYYELHVEGTAREIYAVAADSEEEARAKFERGDLPKPFMSEVDSAEVTQVLEKEF